MKIAEQAAKHFREIYFGGNWTEVNLKDSLADLGWQQATTKIFGLNSILALVYHIHFYVGAVTRVFNGLPLDTHDRDSFNHPIIESQADWNIFLEQVWTEAENFAALIEQMPESRFGETFTNEKYGIYYRNIHGIIEHAHYHTGQIVLIKKLLQNPAFQNL